MFSWAASLFGAGRSGRWRSVREAHLRREPFCQACGRARDLEVHHITPVHAGGAELEPENLISLCRDCHLSIGHAYNWMAYRPDVRAVARAIRAARVVTPN